MKSKERLKHKSIFIRKINLMLKNYKGNNLTSQNEGLIQKQFSRKLTLMNKKAINKSLKLI